MIRLSLEGQAQVTMTRRKDVLYLTLPPDSPGAAQRTVTLSGDGSFTFFSDGRVKQGKLD